MLPAPAAQEGRKSSRAISGEMAESCCDVSAILGSAVLPKRSKIIFLDHNPERLLQPTQFIFIQAVSLDEHQYVQLPYINISLQHFKLIQKFGSSFLSDTCVSIITFFLQSTKKHAKISHSIKATSNSFEVSHKTFSIRDPEMR